MKKYIIAAIVTLSLGLFSPVGLQPAYAACSGDTTPVGQAQRGIGETGGNCSASGVTDFIQAIVNLLSYVVGVAAIIMIIVSGFKYITSGGDSAKITSAKNTLIYALIGLVVAALAQFLTHFVLKAV